VRRVNVRVASRLWPKLHIPYQALSAEALRAVIEEFVTREGTDYGHFDHALEAKCAAVQRQLETGRAVIDWDPRTQTCHIVAQS